MRWGAVFKFVFETLNPLSHSSSPDIFHSFAVYDADAYSPCRYHLLKRSQPSSGLKVLPNGSSVVPATPPLPGTAGRWSLQEDASNLGQFSHMISRISSMSQVYTLYYFLQGIVLLMLVFHLIHAIGFQARLSVIPGEHESPVLNLALTL